MPTFLIQKFVSLRQEASVGNSIDLILVACYALQFPVPQYSEISRCQLLSSRYFYIIPQCFLQVYFSTKNHIINQKFLHINLHRYRIIFELNKYNFIQLLSKPLQQLNRFLQIDKLTSIIVTIHSLSKCQNIYSFYLLPAQKNQSSQVYSFLVSEGVYLRQKSLNYLRVCFQIQKVNLKLVSSISSKSLFHKFPLFVFFFQSRFFFVLILEHQKKFMYSKIIINIIFKMQKGEAVPFILIDENVNNKDVQYSFKIHPRAHEVFNSDAVRNKKVAIAAVAGPQRTGKSFLSNRLLKRMTGFAIGPTTMPCTKGLWIWGEPIKVSEDTVLIIMDTQGLNSVQRDVNVDLKIFSLSILLSSVFIYNSIGHIDQKALENMSYVLRVSQNIKIGSDNESDSQMSKYFPFFYWVLRDFSLDLKGMSENQYLEQSLRPISTDEKDPRNQIRAKIRKLFSQRRCQCFPRPVLQENRLAHIEELQYDDLRQNFKNKMKSFERAFFSNLPPKTINNRPITGSIYLNLAYQYVNAMNNGKIPKIMNSLQSVIASQVRKVCDSYKSNYKSAMDQIMKPEKLPMEDSDIEKNYRNFISIIEQKLNDKFKIWGDVKIVQDARTKLMQDLANDLKDRLKENSKLAEVSANKSLLKLFEQITLPQLKNSEMITISLVSEKQQQFSKKYVEYLQSNKSSTKYVVFTKKFPTLIFDFFGKLIARIKGVYTDQLNALKMQTKNSRAEIDSVKRIMKEQQNLILQKQKQVQAISFQKNQYKRELKKNQQLAAFEKQSQKMSKNDLRRTLDDLKKQVLQLQNEKQQIYEQNQKLKNQISNMKTNKQFITVPSTNHSQNADQMASLPTDIVEAMLQLKGKLSVMNQFYDKKARDQTLDEYMNRQIEEYRTDKYETIEKVKQQCRLKIQQYRHKIQKIIQTHQQEFNMMNRHLDDVKKQNIDLLKSIAENPGSQQKAKGFIAEKKKFQESLRLKQVNLNSQIALNAQMQRQIAQLKLQYQNTCFKLAQVTAAKANLDSFKGSFWYLLRQSLYLATGKKNKFNHARQRLDPQDKKLLTDTMHEVGIKI